MKKLAIMLLLITTVYGQNKVPNIRLKMLDGKYAKLYDLLKVNVLKTKRNANNCLHVCCCFNYLL